ncbi:hypothetical protein NDU88_003731 [Pleurodeles waltl]|uniref:Uncharacterized protein n=1 Tax=Pleurodeles waltl TaxID=8319 RepID=A0AAV7SGR9_PLEWA|nr:hypothetical protein NDU88_003731 [Pleurodeles waltl]
MSGQRREGDERPGAGSGWRCLWSRTCSDGGPGPVSRALVVLLGLRPVPHRTGGKPELADSVRGGAHCLLGDLRGTTVLGYLGLQPYSRRADGHALTLW